MFCYLDEWENRYSANDDNAFNHDTQELDVDVGDDEYYHDQYYDFVDDRNNLNEKRYYGLLNGLPNDEKDEYSDLQHRKKAKSQSAFVSDDNYFAFGGIESGNNDGIIARFTRSITIKNNIFWGMQIIAMFVGMFICSFLCCFLRFCGYFRYFMGGKQVRRENKIDCEKSNRE